MARVPTQGIDYTNKDYEAFRAMMLKELGIKMPEYTDKRQSDAGVVILELLSQGLDILSYYQDVIANEVYLSTAEQMNSVLKWCYMLGYIPRYASPAKFKQVFVLSSVQATDTVIPKGTVVKTVKSSVEEEVRFETVKNLVIPAGKKGDEKDTSGEYLYTVDVVQGTSVLGELLGSSNNTPNQKFTLNYSPVIADSVEIRVNEGEGFERWTRVDSFVESEPTSKHYTLVIGDNDKATITFGNGVFGKIPLRFTNGIYCDYRIGGGIAGNVGANKITSLGSNLALVARTFNPDTAFEYGQDKESIEEIKVNAPHAIRTTWGALTLEDFSAVICTNFPEVVQSISDRSTSDIDDLYVYLLLKDNMPITDTFRDRVLSLFNENEEGRKIVGAKTIFIEPATLVPLTFEGRLVVHDYYPKDEVEQQIRDFVENYFAIGNYPFAKELSLTELSAQIMNPSNAISGVKSFRFTKPSSDILTPQTNEIYTLGSLTFDTTGGV